MAAFSGLVNQAADALGNLAGRPNERQRQQLTGDDKYYREFIAFFELVQPNLPAVLFPLICGISQYQHSDPFALEVRPTDYGGLGVHRSGVVQRRLQISGHTGFAPRPLPLGLLPPSPSRLKPNFAPRNLPKKVLAPLSGQKIFQYLQEELFWKYGELCRDPRTASGTKLFFHDPREDNHWQVEPASFNLQRGPQSNFTYPYSIDLIIVGPAAATQLQLPQADRGVLDQLTETVAQVTDALANLSGAVDDLSRLQGNFRVLGQKVAGIVDGATTVVQAASAFVEGTERLINVPLASVYALFGLCAEVCALYGNLVDAGTAPGTWPRSVLAQFRSMQNACDQLLGQTRLYSPPINQRLEVLENREPNQDAPITQAVTFEAINAAGTANLPGRNAAQTATAQPGADRPTYQSVRQVAVQQGDTLQTLAARELGDPRLWRDLAVLNDLKPPYSLAGDRAAVAAGQADGQAGALTYGQPILVPQVDPPPEAISNPAVLGVAPTAPQSEQALGRGLQLQRLPLAGGEPLYDLVLGDTAGQADLATRAGVDNLTQAVEQNVVLPRGGSPMYPEIGLEGLVGTGIAEVDESLRNYRIAQAIQADPRVQALVSLQVAYGAQADQLLVAATCAVANGAQQATVQVQV